MGRNLTSTHPSVVALSLFTHQGKVAEPDWRRTLPLLGAVGSGSTVHFGVPRPVAPQVHPAGAWPTTSVSKLMFAAIAFTVKESVAASRTVFMPCSLALW